MPTFPRYSPGLAKLDMPSTEYSRVSHADEPMEQPRPARRRRSDSQNWYWRTRTRIQSRARTKDRATAEHNHCSA